ncbi:MAG: GNAT family N-acetyltransferase [Pyrinomonadaceae bacterium]
MLETERLFLRPFEESDADAVFEMRRDEEIMRFIRQPQTKRDESLNWIKMISQRWETERIGFCGVFEKATGDFVGWCGLWQLKETGEIEVGYALAKAFWGNGYATEAARRMLEYGFETLGLEKIVAVASPENRSSQNVMKRLGMEFIGLGRFYENELVQYVIERDEWEKRRSETVAEG